MRSRSASEIRNDSRFAILKELLTTGEATRQQLASATTLSTATVANVVTELTDAGLVHVVGKGTSIGRPSSKLAISDDLMHLVGVDVAETYVNAAVYTLSLEQVNEFNVALDDHDNQPDTVIAGIVAAVRGAMKGAGLSAEAVGGIGISVPGQVMPDTGVSVFAPNWDWHGVKLRELIEPELGLNVGVHIDNPLKAVTIAEMWLGRGAPGDTTVVVNLGTGVGAGIAWNGRLVRGSTNNAGEWGHTTLVRDGRQCRCGRRGCVEAYVGVPGIQATLAELAPGHKAIKLGQQAFIKAVLDGLGDNDPAIVEAMEVTCRSLATGLGDIVNFLNPDRIVLCGWMFRSLKDWVMPRITSMMQDQALGTSLSVVSVEPLEIGIHPVTAGMAIFALEDVLTRAGLPSRVV